MILILPQAENSLIAAMIIEYYLQYGFIVEFTTN
jgi:hypothetical protein